MFGLLLRALLDPAVAAYVGAAIAGHPSFGPQLHVICLRESRGACEPTGVHEGDAGASRSVWRHAVARQLVDPACQPDRPGVWSTRGAYGTMAGYTLHHLGACLPPEVLDVALVAAVAATRRAHGWQCDHVGACRRWRGW